MRPQPTCPLCAGELAFCRTTWEWFCEDPDGDGCDYAEKDKSLPEADDLLLED